MGTRSVIGRLNQDGTVTSIYCHWDGYPDHNGRILHEHYRDEEKLAALLALGDISSLAPELGEKHSFDSRPEGVVTAYGRDRGETGIEAQTTASERAFWKDLGERGDEYRYLLKGCDWLISDGGAGPLPLVEVLEAIGIEKATEA